MKGSYVLDVLFGTSHASDIDVFWLKTGGQPSNNHIHEWMGRCGFGEKPPQAVQVRDFFACDGGGEPICNIDLWRIEMDGVAYQMDPATHEAIKLPVAPGSPSATRTAAPAEPRS